MPKDQVEIKFGPARFDSPKAVRRAIEESSTTTEENTINNIINNPTLDIGGGASATQVTVSTYDPVTGVGTGIDDNGNPFTFDNGTGVYLSPGDVVTVMDTTNGNDVAIAITDRSGEVTPADQPIAVVSTNFPLALSSKPFPIVPDSNAGANAVSLGLPTVAHDLAGELGFGVDTIIGNNIASLATSTNAFVRSAASSLSLYSAISYTGSGTYYVQPGGRVIITNNAWNTMYYRLPGALSWTAAPTTGTVKWAADRDTGAVWGITASAALTPYAYTVYRFLPTDASPVNMGSMGIPNAYAGAQDSLIAAGNGYLTMSSTTSSTLRNYCVKPSSDSTNFTAIGSYAQASWTPTTTLSQQHRLQVDSTGATTYISVSGGTAHIRALMQSLVIADYDTGIPFYSPHGAAHKHLSSGLVAIICTVLTTVFGDTNLNRYTPIIATYNYSTTAYQYYDIAVFGLAGSAPSYGAIQEVTAGTIRWTYPGFVMELTGL